MIRVRVTFVLVSEPLEYVSKRTTCTFLYWNTFAVLAGIGESPELQRHYSGQILSSHRHHEDRYERCENRCHRGSVFGTRITIHATNI